MSAPALDDVEAGSEDTSGAVIGRDSETPGDAAGHAVAELLARLPGTLTAADVLAHASPASLDEALLVIQAKVIAVRKSREADVEHRNGGAHQYRYADLARDVYATLKPELTALGLLWKTKPLVREDGRFVLRYALKHVPTNESDGGDWPLGSPDQPPQSLGSATTYGQRYALLAALGIAPTNDDDARAGQRTATTPPSGSPGNAGASAGQTGRKPSSARDIADLAVRIVSNTDTEAADRMVAWLQEAQLERRRTPLPDDWRARLGITEKAPTLLAVAQIISQQLHRRDNFAAADAVKFGRQARHDVDPDEPQATDQHDGAGDERAADERDPDQLEDYIGGRDDTEDSATEVLDPDQLEDYIGGRDDTEDSATEVLDPEDYASGGGDHDARFSSPFPGDEIDEAGEREADAELHGVRDDEPGGY